MKNKLIIILAVSFALLIIVIALSFKEKITYPDIEQDDITAIQPFDPKNVSYIIDGLSITLKDGLYSSPLTDATSSRITVKYAGNEVSGDIDGDGVFDKAYIISKETEGGNLYYYAAMLLDKKPSSITLSPIIIGDRVVVQKMYIDKDKIIINYLERKPGEDFKKEPSVADTIILKYESTLRQMKFIADKFDVDISTLSLTMKPWRWVSTSYSKSKITRPHNDDTFLLTFNSDGSFYSSTDCNTLNGFYSTDRNSIFMKNIISTFMACVDSKEDEYKAMLYDVIEYNFTTKGELVLTLEKDQGQMFFR